MRRRLGRPIGINLRLNREFRRGEGGWVDVVWAFMVARMGIKLSGHNPTPGRPQGSPLRTTRPPPLQRYGSANARFVVFVRAGVFVVFVRAGVVRMSGWDPCGRPGVGRSSSSSSPPSLQQMMRAFVLATFLWMSEYREHHFPTSPVSHA